MVKWQLWDGASTYVFEVNPNEGGSLTRRKNITDKATSAIDGKTILMEGRPDPAVYEFSGTVFDQNQFLALESWFSKSKQIRVTDDLGRQFWIYMTDFQPRRRRSATRQWLHDYTIRALVLDI